MDILGDQWKYLKVHTYQIDKMTFNHKNENQFGFLVTKDETSS